MEYQIKEIRIEEDTALLILSSESDSFGVSIPFQELQSLPKRKLESFLKEKIKERLQLLATIKRQEEEDKKKLKSIKHLIGRKIKIEGEMNE